MNIRVLGGGWYGCHLALALLRAGHQVQLHELADHLFAGASGANPARLHKGFHYPRSRLTRAACQDHAEAFMAAYGHLTRTVPVNVYAVAAHDSLVDFGTYLQVLRGEVEFVTCDRPAELGLEGVEGAVLTGERHVVIDQARQHFTDALGDVVRFHTPAGLVDDPAWDTTIDCTFCANDAEAIDRYEPCVTVLVHGPTDKAVTIMDGPFPSLYPWDEARGLSSLTSARWTPLSKTCRTWAQAQQQLRNVNELDLSARICAMFDQLCEYWPDARRLYRLADYRLAVRAMPRSGADARLVDVVPVGQRAMRVRAGKIDAIFRAEHLVLERLAANA